MREIRLTSLLFSTVRRHLCLFIFFKCLQTEVSACKICSSIVMSNVEKTFMTVLSAWMCASDYFCCSINHPITCQENTNGRGGQIRGRGPRFREIGCTRVWGARRRHALSSSGERSEKGGAFWIRDGSIDIDPFVFFSLR